MYTLYHCIFFYWAYNSIKRHRNIKALIPISQAVSLTIALLRTFQLWPQMSSCAHHLKSTVKQLARAWSMAPNFQNQIKVRSSSLLGTFTPLSYLIHIPFYLKEECLYFTKLNPKLLLLIPSSHAYFVIFTLPPPTY